MSTESEAEILKNFRSEFSESTGVVIRNQTHGIVYGTFETYDNGLLLPHIISGLPEDKFTVTSPILSGPDKQNKIYLVKENKLDGANSAILYENPDAETEESVFCVVGHTQFVRTLGRYFKNSENKNAHSKPSELPITSLFSWIKGRTSYDAFVPSDLRRPLNMLSRVHTVVINPEIGVFDKNHIVFRAFAVIDEKCFVISGHDYVDILGDYFLCGEVAANFEKDIMRRYGRFYNMLVRRENGQPSTYIPSRRETITGVDD